jgi:hypothetical protein
MEIEQTRKKTRWLVVNELHTLLSSEENGLSKSKEQEQWQCVGDPCKKKKKKKEINHGPTVALKMTNTPFLADSHLL